MNTEDSSPDGRIEVGRYARLTDANERTIVILAMGIGCWVIRDGSDFVLSVENRHLAAVTRELEKFETENVGRADRASQRLPREKIPPVSLFIFGWMMSLFFLAQQNAPQTWTGKGAASSEAIMQHGEWWRTITALTLHADIAHLAANLATGLLFAAFLILILGTGLAWISILLGGALGNYLNAWGYRQEQHLSIGASTAVFSALGILVACQTVSLLGQGRRVRLWEIILPAGAGLALLAWLGRGDAETDYMAHFWGFAAGCAVGAAVALLKLKEHLSPFAQKALAALALALPVAAWAKAVG